MRHLLVADNGHPQSLSFLAALPEECLVLIPVAECRHWTRRAQGRWRPLLRHPAQDAVPHEGSQCCTWQTWYDSIKLGHRALQSAHLFVNAPCQKGDWGPIGSLSRGWGQRSRSRDGTCLQHTFLHKLDDCVHMSTCSLYRSAAQLLNLVRL